MQWLTEMQGEVVEKDLHSFDNSAGSGNISGVYQWVTKVYEAQVFNYGLRVMFASHSIQEHLSYY